MTNHYQNEKEEWVRMPPKEKGVRLEGFGLSRTTLEEMGADPANQILVATVGGIKVIELNSLRACLRRKAEARLAEISSSSGPSDLYDSAGPPGMIDGPFSAPSSPPEMPAPTKCRPRSRIAFSRRMVSV